MTGSVKDNMLVKVCEYITETGGHETVKITNTTATDTSEPSCIPVCYPPADMGQIKYIHDLRQLYG